MKVSVLGYGTVGRGVYDMIKKSSFLEAGKVLEAPAKATESFMVDSIDKITSDNSVDAVVECIGGVGISFEFVSACLKAGKHVVTSNKALVAAKGIELIKLAQESGAGFLFSAACGGAIPVLHNLSVARKTDEIISCRGILNGTTNFILSSIREGRFNSYLDALKEAQALGYAEADPTADVSGMDTMRKIILLSAVGFDMLPSDGWNKEGIENIDLAPLSRGNVKLVGSCGKNSDGSVYAYVEPVLCSKNSLFNSINSNFNAAQYIGKNCDSITLIGQGAGMFPTASAVLRDLTAIYEGERNMMNSSCREVKADNSQIKHRYIICHLGKVEETEPVSVEKMHSDVEKMRNNGEKVFFAAIEE